MNILAIDLGGTSAKVGLVSNEGKVLKFVKVSTDKNNIIENIKQGIKDEIKDDEYDLLAFAAPGAIDTKHGLIKWSGNLEVENYELEKECMKVFNKKAFILNDANAAVLGEHWLGNAQGVDNVVMYTLGTGIGGGIICNGEMVAGQFGFAGELGHGGNFQNEFKCNCGNDNCIEPKASAIAIQKQVNKFIDENNLTDKYKDKHLSEIILDGNKDINDIYMDCLAVFADAVSAIIYALDPGVVLIGGGISELGDKLTNDLKELLKTRVGKVFLEGKEIKLAKLGNDAGMLGAAYYALKNFKK